MDDWKLKAQAVVKLKKRSTMLVSSCPSFGKVAVSWLKILAAKPNPKKPLIP